jgi:murein DD-endopeptidase MepM/ murein hydrolase activator NlpD
MNDRDADRDERTDSDEHGPVGSPGDGRRGGEEPPDYVGVRDHGQPGEGRRGTGRRMASRVWGGSSAEVTSEHAEPCGYCGSSWPNSVCMSTNTHPGVDIGIVRGTPLFAAAGGTVEFAGWGEYYRPHHVDIRTADGELHIYAHMWSVDPSVRVGGRVQAGDYLGTSGEQTNKGTMTPDGTGAHLHFERRQANNCALNPESTLVNGGGGGNGGGGDAQPLRCPPDPAPEYTGDRVKINNVTFHPARQRVASDVDGLRRRKWASTQACETGDPLQRGERVRVLFWVKGEPVEGEERWWVAEDGSRIWAGGTMEKP